MLIKIQSKYNAQYANSTEQYVLVDFIQSSYDLQVSSLYSVIQNRFDPSHTRTGNREHSQLVELHPWFGSQELLGFPPEEWGPVEPQEEDWFLRDGSSILRTYETDFELRPFEDGGIGIMYEHPMTQTRRPTLGPARLAMERLGTLLLVPELSLVVGASMSGRIALVTLTRQEPVDVVLGLKRGFKIEAILPTEQDEDKNMRPLCPLYGVAVGPLPQTPRGKMAGQNRYRRKPTSSSCL